MAEARKTREKNEQVGEMLRLAKFTKSLPAKSASWSGVPKWAQKRFGTGDVLQSVAKI